MCNFPPHLAGHEYFPWLRNPLKAVYDDYIMFGMCHDSFCLSLLVEVEVSGWSLAPIPPWSFLLFPPSGQYWGEE